MWGKGVEEGTDKTRASTGWGDSTKVGECGGSTRGRGRRKQTFFTAVREECAVSSPRFWAGSCEWE